MEFVPSIYDILLEGLVDDVFMNFKLIFNKARKNAEITGDSDSFKKTAMDIINMLANMINERNASDSAYRYMYKEMFYDVIEKYNTEFEEQFMSMLRKEAAIRKQKHEAGEYVEPDREPFNMKMRRSDKEVAKYVYDTILTTFFMFGGNAEEFYQRVYGFFEKLYEHARFRGLMNEMKMALYKYNMDMDDASVVKYKENREDPYIIWDKYKDTYKNAIRYGTGTKSFDVHDIYYVDKAGTEVVTFISITPKLKSKLLNLPVPDYRYSLIIFVEDIGNTSGNDGKVVQTPMPSTLNVYKKILEEAPALADNLVHDDLDLDYNSPVIKTIKDPKTRFFMPRV